MRYCICTLLLVILIQQRTTHSIVINKGWVADGNIHYHDKNNKKYYYDFESGKFDGLSKSALKRLSKLPGFSKGGVL